MRSLVVVVLVSASILGSPVRAQSAASEETAWRDFLDWWRVQDRSTDDPRPGYCALKKFTEAECQRWFEAVKRLAQQRPDEAAGAQFDQIYRDKKPPFRTAPMVLLTKVIDGLAPGSALDVHMGQGRNALYLAKNRWAVTGFDSSPEAIRLTRAQAAAAGLRIDARLSGHQNFEFGKEQWDLIVLSYAMIPLDDAALVNRILSSLRPNGRLVFEHHMRASCTDEDKTEWRPCANQLLALFSGLRVLFYEETKGLPEWGPKTGDVVRFVGQRTR